MLRHTSSASRKPTSVPTTPTEAPVTMKTRMIAPCVTPIVRRMPMAALVLDQHDQAGRDVEGRDNHDDRQDQEHHVAFDLQRIEEGGVALPPIDHEDRSAGGLGDEPAEAIDLVRLVDINLDRGDVAG